MNFNVEINASAEKVWQILWNDKTYPQWTSVFGPDSHAETDWQEGSRVLFLSGNGDGMYALIEKSVPQQVMVFRHLGEIKDGVEKPFDEKLSFGTESYFLTEENGKTGLAVELTGVPAEYADFFNDAFPKALAIVKELSEQA